MKSFIGTTALVFLAAMSTTATADSIYQYIAQGSVGATGHDFTITAIVHRGAIEEVRDGDFGLYMTYQTSNVVFRNNGALLDTSDFTYTQYVEGLDYGPITRGVHVLFHTPSNYSHYHWEVPFEDGDVDDTNKESERLLTHMGVSGGGTFQPPEQVHSLEIHSSSLVPFVPVVPGVGALAPLAGIAGIRRRRRR